MIGFLRAGLVSAAMIAAAATTLTAPANAGGLNENFRGSVKDFGYAPRPAAGPCYARADIGYSLSGDPDVKWPVNNIDRTVNPEPYPYVGDEVTGTNFGDTWAGDVGFGGGQGSRGFRAEIMYGYRGNRDFFGIPRDFVVLEPGGPTEVDDPIHSSLTSHLFMANVYYDLGKWYGRFVPYVGLGIGAAYHQLDEVYFTQNPFLTNRIQGNDDFSFAWSVMTGVAYQVSDRAVLDLGYRYLDMGAISSGRVDSAGFTNPQVDFDDITAHEFKIGLRYHFGSRHASVESWK